MPIQNPGISGAFLYLTVVAAKQYFQYLPTLIISDPMQNHFNTQRLLLDRLHPDDTSFVLGLVNSPGWLRFIGNRNIRTISEAKEYVRKLSADPNAYCWTVRLKESTVPVGIITFIRREYLEHRDIGFAFLPEYAGKGYAGEAAGAVLDYVKSNPVYRRVLATTVRDNENSIRLLEKLGLQREGEVRVDNETLLLFGMDADGLLIDKLTCTFFSIFTNKEKIPDLELIHKVCVPETLFICKKGLEQDIYNLQSFLAPRRQLLSDGTLTGFEEKETYHETKITGNIAQRFSHYEKSGVLQGASFRESGHKLFQFIRTQQGWRISAVSWEDKV